MALCVFLLRHGVAQSGSGIPDGERALTAGGAAEVKALARELVGRGARLDLALSSPLKRAQQTAEIVWRAVGNGGPVQTVAALSPSSTASAMMEAIVEEMLVAPTARCILVVSHMPVIGELAGYLAGAGAGGDRMFATAELRCISFEDGLRPGHGELRWCLPSR